MSLLQNWRKTWRRLQDACQTGQLSAQKPRWGEPATLALLLHEKLCAEKNRE
jgi:hypothetical protein